MFFKIYKFCSRNLETCRGGLHNLHTCNLHPYLRLYHDCLQNSEFYNLQQSTELLTDGGNVVVLQLGTIPCLLGTENHSHLPYSRLQLAGFLQRWCGGNYVIYV